MKQLIIVLFCSVVAVGQTYIDPSTFNPTPVNWSVPDASHDADAYSITQSLVPLNAIGQPDPVNGSIGLIPVGMSNVERKWCGDQINNGHCFPGSVMDLMSKDPALNPQVKVANCAEEGAGTYTWAYSASNVVSHCNQELALRGLTPAQVQVVWFEDVDNQEQAMGLNATVPNPCPLVANPIHPPVGASDYCVYQQILPLIIRRVKKAYPNLKVWFMNSRAYGGYAIRWNCALGYYGCPDDEPYSWLNATSAMGLVQAQIDQVNSGIVNPLYGDLSYPNMPIFILGVNLWAPRCGLGTRPDGFCAQRSDFAYDGLHPAEPYNRNVSQQLYPWLQNSIYTSWFRR